jgi:hypothetical protein
LIAAGIIDGFNFFGSGVGVGRGCHGKVRCVLMRYDYVGRKKEYTSLANFKYVCFVMRCSVADLCCVFDELKTCGELEPRARSGGTFSQYNNSNVQEDRDNVWHMAYGIQY